MVAFLKKLIAKHKRKENVAASTLSGSYETSIVPPLAAISAVVLPQPAKRDVGHIGMQGYAPIVRISQNRRYCEFCAERVLSGIRHVCWGNVEHHMHSLSDDERIRIMDQLGSKPRKLTRAQLRKLYSADRLGLAVIEGERYGG